MRKALASLPWVRQVRVDFAKKQAVVIALAENYDAKALLKALEEAGFGATVVSPRQPRPDESTSSAEPSEKIDPARQIVFRVEGFT